MRRAAGHKLTPSSCCDTKPVKPNCMSINRNILKFTASAGDKHLESPSNNLSSHLGGSMDAKKQTADIEFNLSDSPQDEQHACSAVKASTVRSLKKRQSAEVNIVADELVPIKHKKMLEETLEPAEEDGIDYEIPDMDVDHDMKKMLATFGVDIGKSLSSRKKKLEMYTTGCLKSGTRKMEEAWQFQQDERLKLQNDFQARVLTLFGQWELDIERTKENEEKLQTQLKQQQKLFQQSRLVQTQRVTAMRELCDTYHKNSELMEKNHQAQQSTSHAEMKRELVLLQKKILIDAQKQEMDNVKKSLHALFY